MADRPSTCSRRAPSTMRRHLLILLSVICALLAAQAAATATAPDPYATTSGPDGTLYSFYRTPEPITASQASAACAAAGGTLASFTDAAQVRATIWSNPVIEVGSEDPVVIWTGLRISWPKQPPPPPVRRMLRAGGSLSDSDAAVAEGEEVEVEVASRQDNVEAASRQQRTLLELVDAADSETVPRTASDGTPIPDMLRHWMHEKQQQQQRRQRMGGRALLGAGAGTGDGDESPYLRNGAVLTWEDGSDASFVLTNRDNFGFGACTNKRKGCCGAVYDIGPAAYAPAEFPTVFFFPCDSTEVSIATPPSGYICAVNPVAELSQPTPTQSADPPPATRKKDRQSPPPPPAPCSPGSAPAKKSDPTTCEPCKRNTYSPDGYKCRACPEGTKSGKGARKCK